MNAPNTYLHYVSTHTNHLSRNVSDTQKSESAPIRIDIHRMQEALDTESYTIPEGLLDEEDIIHFILTAGKTII